MTGHACTAECWEHMLRTGLRLTVDCTSGAARLAAEGTEADAVDGGWVFNGEKGWLLDPGQKERVRRNHVAAMARIDEKQKDYPTCALCGQRARVLDEFGLCSKISEPHKDWRAAGRSERAVSFR